MGAAYHGQEGEIHLDCDVPNYSTVPYELGSSFSYFLSVGYWNQFDSSVLSIFWTNIFRYINLKTIAINRFRNCSGEG